jgi:hypothetical protein
MSQLQNSQGQSLASVAGTDTITGTVSPTLTAYASGQVFYFTAAGTNTGATTINIDSVGAKALYRDGAACTAGSVVSGKVYQIKYNGTQFDIIGTNNYAGLNLPAFTTTIGVGAATASSSGAGITFPAPQSASTDPNTLDDYEEGTWTPVLTFATPGNLSVAYTDRIGRYTKIGRLVFCDLNIETSTFTHTTASGNLNVTGLPFTSATLTNALSLGGGSWSGITKANYTQVASVVASNSSLLVFQISGSGQAVNTLVPSDMPTGGTVRLRFSFSYVV